MKLSDYFDSQPRGAAIRLAKAIGAFSSDMSSWAMGRRPVPAERCPAIERATGGLVRCEDLRPDVDWSVLRSTPELAQAPVTIAPIATETVAHSPAFPSEPGALRAGVIRRQAARRAALAADERRAAERRAQAGPPFQSPEVGVA